MGEAWLTRVAGGFNSDNKPKQNNFMRERKKYGKYITTNESFQNIFEEKIYECDLITAPKTVLDIGANEGAFTAWCLEKYPGCKIEAYEPMPENAEIFRLNHGENSQVKLYELAVMNQPTCKIYFGKNNSGDCSAYDIGDQLPDFMAAICVPPSSLTAAEFVKVDTEGCELEIISGLDLSKTVALVCEWHRDDDCRKIIEIVQKAGLKLFHCRPWHKDRGEMGFARPGARKQDLTPQMEIPDETRLSGNTKDGRLISITAGTLRNEHYDPRLKDVKLFIGLPIYGQPTMAFVKCLMALMAQKPCHVEIHVGQGDGVGRTRNVLTANFLKTDCTHLLFMDSDLIWTIDHVKHLLLADQGVVGGFYPKKQQGKLEWVVNSLIPSPEVRPDHLQALRYIGTGFLCVKRDVFLNMAGAYPEISFREDYSNREIAYDFWSMGVYRDKKNPADEGRYLSEDWFFCQRWLDLGGEVFGHTRVALRHLGPVIFPLETQMPEVTNPVP